MTVWAVVADTSGAWEAECVYSLWSEESAAEEEIRRLEAIEDFSAGCYGGDDLYVVAVEVNRPSDEWIQ